MLPEKIRKRFHLQFFFREEGESQTGLRLGDEAGASEASERDASPEQWGA